jgi:hypothetical protein
MERPPHEGPLSQVDGGLEVGAWAGCPRCVEDSGPSTHNLLDHIYQVSTMCDVVQAQVQVQVQVQAQVQVVQVVGTGTR